MAGGVGARDEGVAGVVVERVGEEREALRAARDRGGEQAVGHVVDVIAGGGDVVVVGVIVSAGRGGEIAVVIELALSDVAVDVEGLLDLGLLGEGGSGIDGGEHGGDVGAAGGVGGPGEILLAHESGRGEGELLELDGAAEVGRGGVRTSRNVAMSCGRLGFVSQIFGVAGLGREVWRKPSNYVEVRRAGRLRIEFVLQIANQQS